MLDTKKPTIDDFMDLVATATDILNATAGRDGRFFDTHRAQQLEDDVVDALNRAAGDGPFRGTVRKISGQHFPDIVVADRFGLEVKSSKADNWITLGGSINESTRMPDLDCVFLLFGKLSAPVQFICRPYQDCLADVLVTHYPRYKIDMKLAAGETIFDKMDITYDQLRQKDNPVKDVIQYYKKLLKPGERLWWLDYDNNSDANPAANSDVADVSARVRLWKTLSASQRDALVTTAYALFPEIVGDARDKYDNFSLWLVSNHGVVSTSVRDVFSAGGRCGVKVGNRKYMVSRTICNLRARLDAVRRKLESVPEHVLMDVWNTSVIRPDRFAQWLDMVIEKNPECRYLMESVAAA